MKMPTLLDEHRHNQAVDVLSCYYGLGRHDGHTYTGAWFDTWDSTGTREADANRFTADDLVAVTFLTVEVPPRAAVELLDTRAEEFSQLLKEVGPDRDLVTETTAWTDDWAGWRLWNELIGIDGIGATTASKLYARKRPRLRPIYDTVISHTLGSRNIWEPLRAQLQQGPDLHRRLEQLRTDAGVNDQVSAIRIFDVLTWMEGKGHLDCG